jgi:valyl-tRNA synthetase
MLERFPESDDFPADAAAETEIEWLKSFVVGIRQIRSEMNLSPSKPLPVKLAGATAADRARLASLRMYIEKLARVASIDHVADSRAVRGAASALLGELHVLVPLAGLVDVRAEIERLDKQLTRARKDLDACRRKLDNADFVDNAPPEIVAKENARAVDLGQRIERLDLQLKRMREIQ